MYIADLHIHSRYSMATSKDCTPEHLDLWARKKGIHIVGTGDFTHAAWRTELAEKLEPAEDGLYVLKPEFQIAEEGVPDSFRPRFVITGEISSIYKKAGKVRKVHSLILLPGLEAAEQISQKLAEIGNIHSDGRPILGLDCRDLLEILLELCPASVYVPAHIWTPHFSLFGAFSDFQSVEECYEDLSPYVRAVETGLSSDPPMNWRVSALDRYQLISNSDAHSPAKLGREANLLDIELSYDGLCRAIEFFPEEGKYHYDGHRKCKICLTPSQTAAYHGICPVCGRKITVGVCNRIGQLADRPEGFVPAEAKAFERLVPLPEVLAASMGCSSASVKVKREYERLIRKLGSEFEILRTVPLEDIRPVSGSRIAEGIQRLRRGDILRIPGFDGEYGTIQIFRGEELEETDGQLNLFGIFGGASGETSVLNGEDKASDKTGDRGSGKKKEETAQLVPTLNVSQTQAVHTTSVRTAVIAGPGTGKTKTLVARILYLLEQRKAAYSEITAVTFTNQAAEEMRERIQKQLGRKTGLKHIQIGTFHKICLRFLQDHGVTVNLADNGQLSEWAQEICDTFALPFTAGQFLNRVSARKSGIHLNADKSDLQGERAFEEAFVEYECQMKRYGLSDFDDLLLQTAERLEHGTVQKKWKRQFSYVLVDEFQDINPVQQRLVKQWHALGKELFVIGDPDQAIYGFRGSDASCFARLQDQYEDLETICLTENYRSTPEIIGLAKAVIEKNPGGIRLMHPNAPAGPAVRFLAADSEIQEAVFVAKEIAGLTGGLGMLEAHTRSSGSEGNRPVRSFRDIAVLYRTHRQAKLLETCLAKEGIPYEVAGRESFLQDEKVQASMAFFQYLDDPADELAKKRCMHALWHLEEQEVSESVFLQAVERFGVLYPKKKPEDFLKEWMQFTELSQNSNMKKFLSMSVFYSSMPEFVQALLFGVESDLRRCGQKQYTAEAVTLMTLHGSKGLEFPVTVIYGVQKGIIPFESRKHMTDPEEERRLFYVGITRAKEELILTGCGECSEFLEEIPGEYLVKEQIQRKRQEPKYHQMSLFE